MVEEIKKEEYKQFEAYNNFISFFPKVQNTGKKENILVETINKKYNLKYNLDELLLVIYLSYIGIFYRLFIYIS